MGTILKGVGVINIVFGLIIIVSALLSVLLWTWLHQQYAVFIWGGCLIVISGHLTARIADKHNQILTEMAATLAVNSVSMAVCVYMLYQEVINFTGYLNSATNTNLFNPLHSLLSSKSEETKVASFEGEFDDYFSDRTPKEAVVAIDVTLLLSVVIVFVSTVASVVQVRRCITYRAGEDALNSSFSHPLRRYSETLAQTPTFDLPSHPSYGESRCYTSYYDKEHSATCRFCNPKAAQLAHARRAPSVHPHYPVTPDILPHDVMYARY